MNPMRFGVVGAGVISATHLKAIQANEDATVTAICDIVPEKAEARDKQFETHAKIFTSYEELLDSGLVDAVTIATPHPVHPEIAFAAAQRGIHICCEKPLSEQIKTARQMVEAVDAAGVKMNVFFQQRTRTLCRKAREMALSGELGELRRFVYHVSAFRTEYYYASGDWRATWVGEGGGVLINQTPHQLDLFQWIAGQPKRVRGFCHFGKHHDIDVEDDVTAYLEWENGATGTYTASTGEWPRLNRFEIWGDLGRLALDGSKIDYLKCAGSISEACRTAEGTSRGPETEEIDLGIEDDMTGHRGIVKNLVDAARDGADLSSPGREALNSLELANAMVLSSVQGKAIELPLDGDAYAAFLEEKREEERNNPKRRKSAGDRVFNVIDG